MPATELSDDEVAMLNWFQEFKSSKFNEEDETVKALVEKSLLLVSSGAVFVTAKGSKWLDDHSRIFS